MFTRFALAWIAGAFLCDLRGRKKTAHGGAVILSYNCIVSAAELCYNSDRRNSRPEGGESVENFVHSFLPAVAANVAAWLVCQWLGRRK